MGKANIINLTRKQPGCKTTKTGPKEMEDSKIGKKGER